MNSINKTKDILFLCLLLNRSQQKQLKVHINNIIKIAVSQKLCINLKEMEYLFH